MGHSERSAARRWLIDASAKREAWERAKASYDEAADSSIGSMKLDGMPRNPNANKDAILDMVEELDAMAYLVECLRVEWEDARAETHCAIELLDSHSARVICFARVEHGRRWKQAAAESLGVSDATVARREREALDALYCVMPLMARNAQNHDTAC